MVIHLPFSTLPGQLLATQQIGRDEHFDGSGLCAGHGDGCARADHSGGTCEPAAPVTRAMAAGARCTLGSHHHARVCCSAPAAQSAERRRARAARRARALPVPRADAHCRDAVHARRDLSRARHGQCDWVPETSADHNAVFALHRRTRRTRRWTRVGRCRCALTPFTARTTPIGCAYVTTRAAAASCFPPVLVFAVLCGVDTTVYAALGNERASMLAMLGGKRAGS